MLIAKPFVSMLAAVTAFSQSQGASLGVPSSGPLSGPLSRPSSRRDPSALDLPCHIDFPPICKPMGAGDPPFDLQFEHVLCLLLFPQSAVSSDFTKLDWCGESEATPHNASVSTADPDADPDSPISRANRVPRRIDGPTYTAGNKLDTINRAAIVQRVTKLHAKALQEYLDRKVPDCKRDSVDSARSQINARDLTSLDKVNDKYIDLLAKVKLHVLRKMNRRGQAQPAVAQKIKTMITEERDSKLADQSYRASLLTDALTQAHRRWKAAAPKIAPCHAAAEDLR